MIIVGFSLIFLEFGRKIHSDNYASYLLSTYGLLYGNYDTSPLELSETLILVLILFLISIVLLNMLIAIMGDSYDKVQDRKILTDSQERIEMILESTVLMKFFTNRREEKREGYLVFFEALEDDEHDDQAITSEWEGKIHALKKMIRQVGQDLSKDNQELEAKFEAKLEAKLSKSNQELEAKIEAKLEAKLSKSNQELEASLTRIMQDLYKNKS